MRWVGLSKLALVLAALSGCTCQNTLEGRRFACSANGDCAADFVCRGGECRPFNLPGGACFGSETKACAIAGCEQACGPDGGFQACAPASGGAFEVNESHCGECGLSCSARLGNLLECVDSRCACSLDSDCSAGRVCSLSGLCVLDPDPCAKKVCPAGQVCRAGACLAVACGGCEPGEVCDSASASCRRLNGCRLPTPCGDGGICEGLPKPDGESCDDGDLCTHGDVCSGGVCGGNAYTCPGPGVCASASTCAGDGGCDVVALPNGTPCSDDVACTYGDACAGGVCTGTAYTCAPDVCASTSVCGGDGGCVVTPRNAGAVCDDTTACTHTDACSDAGFCVGVAYTCPGVTECREAGLCLGDGGCSVVDKANGTACDAGLGCTTGDTCSGGACSGGTALTSYQDSDSDGRGNANIAQSVCPLPVGFVLASGDCNDSNNFVFSQMSAVQDADQDGVTASTTLNPTACVGATSTVGGRTYYRDSSGAYTWLAAASATADCNDGDGDVFDSMASMVTDADHDGYSSAGPSTACAGASQVFNGRTYYADATGAFVYLAAGSALGSGDCADSDPDIYRTVGSLYLDSDQDGWTSGSPLSRCVGASTTAGGRTYYANASGNFIYGPTSLGADCNDGSAAVTGPPSWYVDGDGDGVGAGAATVQCINPGGQVNTGTDCNDFAILIYTQRNVYLDADQDGWTTASSTTSQCTGASSSAGGRTYYYSASTGTASWGVTSLGVDCNDGSAGTTGPTSWYLDADNDGFGLSTNSVSACANPGTCPGATCRVSNSSDCNDSSINVYRLVANLYSDGDQDGYGTFAGQQCVGANQTINGRTYYANSSAAYVYTPTYLGSDCNSSNGGIFTNRSSVVRDNDRDGCPAAPGTPFTACAGATSTVSGRTFYSDGAGGYYMPETDCRNYQGNTCRDPQDGNDANSAVLCP